MSNFQEFFPNDFVHLLLAAFSADETGIIGGKCPLKQSQAVKFNQETGIYKYMKQEKNVDLNEHLKLWSISEIFDDANSGYLGLLLENKEKKQLVLSHRSTNFKLSFYNNLFKQSGVQCDIMSVVICVFTTHQAQAYQATQRAIEKAKQQNYSLSFCGHSLGAWLAELSVYYCHLKINPPFPNVKTVSYDGPGSFEMMQLMDQQTIKGQSQQFYPEQFDIVFYLSAPNIVNCMNSHIGVGYRLYQENFTQIQFSGIIKYVFEKLTGFQTYIDALEATYGHDLKFIMPLFDPQTGKPKQENYSKIIKWPTIKYQDYGDKGRTEWSQILQMLAPNLYNFMAIKKIISTVEKLAHYVTSCSVVVGILELIRGNINMNQFWQVHEILKKTNQYKPELKNDEEFDLEIKGGYQMTIPNDFERNLTNWKQIDRIDEHLINLKRNSHRIDASQCQRNMKQILIQISNIFEFKREVFSYCIKIKHQFRNQINIVILRDQIRFLIRDHMQDFEDFLNENPYFDDKRMSCFFNRLILYDENYVQRKELNEIEKAFSQSNVVVLTGPTKFGKTVLAYQYAKKQKDLLNAIVLPFNAENQLTLYQDLQFYHHHLYQLPNQQLTFEYLWNDVWAKMQNINQSLIIIFDNLKNIELIQTFITQLKQHFQVIITTVSNQLFNSTKYEIINISAMNEIECLNYIDNSIHKRKLDDQQKQMLIHLSSCIPQLLNLYISQLVTPDNDMRKTEEILANIKQYNKCSFLIKQVEDDYCKTIMKYISWLYPNKIELYLIQQLTQIKEDLVQSSLIKLANKGFITILENQCIMIDIVIQEECREMQQTYMCLTEILMYFYKLLPNIETEKHTNIAWQIAQSSHLHVRNLITILTQKNLFQDFLNNHPDLFLYATITTLKLSIIYQFLIPDYQSCQYYLNLFGEQYSLAMKTKTSINIQALIISIINNTKLFLSMNKKKEALKNYSLLSQIIDTQILDISPTIQSNIYHQLAIVYQSYEQYDLSNQQLEKSMQIKIPNQGEEDFKIQKILMVQAENFQLQKKYNEAINLYQKALQHLGTLEGNNAMRDFHIIKAKLYYQLGKISLKLNQDIHESQKYFSLAILLWKEKLNNIESLEMADFLYQLGLVLKKTKNYNESLELLLNADLQKRKIIGEDQNDSFAEISYQKGLLLIQLNKIDEAEQEFINAKHLILGQDNFKLKSKIDLQIALIYKMKGLKFEYIKALEELISKKRDYYAYIHPTLSYDIQCLADAYGELLQDTAKQTILYQLLYFITILHESQIQYYLQKNPITGLQEQIKFQANNKSSNVQWLLNKDSQNIIKKFDPNFFEKHITRTLLLRSGIITKEEYEIKQILETSTLDYIRQHACQGKWEGHLLTGLILYRGVKDYISCKHLKKQLKEQFNNYQHLKIALMLCFEALNIGIVQSYFEHITLANQFITEIINIYPKMQDFIEDVIKQHPEYLIDGKILKSLTMEKCVLKANLGIHEKIIESNKDIYKIIFTMC